MYSEHRIARHLATLPPHEFDVVVASSADLYFNQPPYVVVSEVLAIHDAGRGLYTSGQNHNYTDGFYIGSPGDVAVILGRFAEFRVLQPLFWIKSQHYEGVLKKAFLHHCISLCWSADGATLFSGYTDGNIRVWSVGIGR